MIQFVFLLSCVICEIEYIGTQTLQPFQDLCVWVLFKFFFFIHIT